MDYNLIQILKKNYGFGYNSKILLKKYGFNPAISIKLLTEKQKKKIFSIKDNMDLKLQKKITLDTYKATNSYKGRRLSCNLPLSGSHTKNNAKTRKKFKII